MIGHEWDEKTKRWVMQERVQQDLIFVITSAWFCNILAAMLG